MKQVIFALFVILASCTKVPKSDLDLEISIVEPDGKKTELNAPFMWSKEQEFTPKDYNLKVLPYIENKTEIKLKVEIKRQSKLLGNAKLTTIFNYPATIDIVNNGKHYKLILIPRKKH